MTSKAALPWVRSVGSGPGGGAVKGKALKHLQPQHADRTDFTTQSWYPVFFTDRCHCEGHTSMQGFGVNPLYKFPGK